MVRTALKKPHGKISEEQLHLWPPEMWPHLQAGGHSALFVPDAGRYRVLFLA